MSLYPVWADVDAIYQVLKQAGEIRGNSTNSPPTPPTAEHPPSGAAPSSARASSHPCSSSTSGKAHQEIPADLGTYVGTPKIFPRITVADYDARHSPLKVSRRRSSNLTLQNSVAGLYSSYIVIKPLNFIKLLKI